MITSQKTNGATDPALFAKGGPPNLHIKVPEIVLQHWAEEKDRQKQKEARATAVSLAKTNGAYPEGLGTSLVQNSARGSDRNNE